MPLADQVTVNIVLNQRNFSLFKQGNQFLLGIRPEHLDITPTGWALTVDALEMLGAERLIYGRWQHGEGDELVINTLEGTYKGRA